MSDNELYYAEMESARNTCEEAYFCARPQSDTLSNRSVFRAGFERAFSLLWRSSFQAASEIEKQGE